MKGKIIFLPSTLPDFKNVFVEYEEDEKVDEKEITNKFYPSKITKKLPLASEDIQRIIGKEGDEVDFYGQESPNGPVAKLYPKNMPTPVYPIPEMWDEIFKEFAEYRDSLDGIKTKSALEFFLKQNYHPPKKK